MARQLLKDTCPTAAAVMAGELDSDLDYIAQAIRARRKAMFRPGSRFRLSGTKNPDLDGMIVTVIRANSATISVGAGEKDAWGWSDGEYNVPPHMLLPITPDLTEFPAPQRGAAS